MTQVPDRIEKSVVLKASPARVWRALTDAREFGSWFGANLSGTYAPGARIVGPVTYPGYEHLTFDMTIERMEPERLISWRWHPHPIDTSVDYSAEPTTLVTFELKPVPEGTLLTVVESGFDQLPISRRAEAYSGNEGGWQGQMENIRNHVSQVG